MDFERFKKIVRPGDLIFYRPKNKLYIGSWFIAWAQNVIGKSPIHDRSYCHVALVDWDENYLLESRWPKSRRWKIKWEKLNKHYHIEVYRIRKVTSQERNAALKWAYDHLGEWYDLGLFVWGMFDFKNAEVCSTFVAKAWKAAGKIFEVHKKLQPDADFHSPDELVANIDLIKRVI